MKRGERETETETERTLKKTHSGGGLLKCNSKYRNREIKNC